VRAAAGSGTWHSGQGCEPAPDPRRASGVSRSRERRVNVVTGASKSIRLVPNVSVNSWVRAGRRLGEPDVDRDQRSARRGLGAGTKPRDRKLCPEFFATAASQDMPVRIRGVTVRLGFDLQPAIGRHQREEVPVDPQPVPECCRRGEQVVVKIQVADLVTTDGGQSQPAGPPARARPAPTAARPDRTGSSPDQGTEPSPASPHPGRARGGRHRPPRPRRAATGTAQRKSQAMSADAGMLTSL